MGFAILVHDLSFIERREAQARTFLFIASGFLAIMAFGVPMFVAKWARYDWSLELRSLLRGGGKQQPGIPAHSERPARTGWPHGQRSRRRSRTVDRGTSETNAEPASARREDRHSGEP